jgi:hypothetical protein
MAAILKAWIANLTKEITGNDAAGEKSIVGLEAQKEAVRHGLAMAQANGTATPAVQKAAADQIAQLDLSIAKIKEETAARDRSTAKMIDQLQNTTESHKRLAAAEKTLEEAHLGAVRALNAFQEEQAKQVDSFGQALGKLLASKIPGLTATDKPGGGIALGFSWQTFLLSAIQNTKSFGDIMKTITEIMGVVAQIFDALRPVIDLFLKGVILIANGFITLWNVIAKLLRLLGIHVALLDKINADFTSLSQNAAPFIQIVHDIPTMNELASGNISPLYPGGTGHDTIINGITTPITDGLADPGLGGGLLGAILQVVAGIEGLKLLSKMTGLSGGLSSIFGSGGKGLVGTVTSVLGKMGLTFGAGTNGTALLGTLGVLAGAAGLGALVGKMEGGGSHTTNGAIGGVVGAGVTGMVMGGVSAMLGGAGGLGGGIAALTAMGPAGWAILAGGTLLGALAGGLFGSKAPNAHDNPDIVTSGYGQSLADLQGSGVYLGKEAMNANGQSYTESGQVASALGGEGEIQYIADYIAKMGGAGLTDQEKATFQGENVKDTIVGGKNGTLNLANGTSIYWSDLVSLAKDSIKKIGDAFGSMANTANGNISSVAGNITRFIDASTNDLAGALTSSGNKTTGPVLTSDADSGGGNKSGKPVITQDAPVTISVTTGDVHGYNDIQQLGYDLADAQARRAQMLKYGFSRIAGAPSP